MTPESVVAQTAALVGRIGARFYFDPATLAKGKEAGLDGFRFYVLGRGGVLGNVDSSVIASAFGYFNPASIAKIWNSARETMAPDECARLYLDCNAAIGRGPLDDVAGLDAFCDAAEQVVANVNPAALALYAGTAAAPLPDDLPGRAMQLLVVHRELRGSQHLAAIVGHGLDPVVAHAIRRPNDTEMFGWPAKVAVPDDAHQVLAAVDAVTNTMGADALGSLSHAQLQAYVDGVLAIDAALAN